MGSDKRKHTRVRHRDRVELMSGDDTFSGTSVNVSKSGMQVVVRMPASHDSIQSIAFQIPGSAEQVRLPCRLIRNTGFEVEGDQVLGIEFLSEDDAQLLLIERFIQDTQPHRDEARQLPRISCHLDDVTVERKDVQPLSIDNLSTEGLLLNFRGTLSKGEKLRLSVGIPGDKRRLGLAGTVVYIVENVFEGTLTAGMRLEALKETEERRLRNLIVICSSGSAIRGLHEHLDSREVESGSRIVEPAAIAAILNSLRAECVRVSTLVDSSFTIIEHEVHSVDESLRQFTIRSDNDSIAGTIQPGTAAYFAFYWNKGSHYFKAAIDSVRENLLVFPLPAAIFRSNKRSYQRKPLNASKVSLTIPGNGSEQSTFEGTLVDISRRGFLCEVRVAAEDQELFLKGQSIRYVIDERLELGSEGQIRHLKTLPSPDGVALHIGIEAGIGRKAVRLRRIPADEWEKGKSTLGGPGGTSGTGRRIESLLVRFPDGAGRSICALLNATKLPARAPVVVIPSAYGKKKEAFLPLVATLLATCWGEGKEIVTLRYDGINRPGESHQDEAHPKRGYEMLSYRISQGAGDLQAALDFVRNNPYFIAEQVIVVSFSMSAIEVRRLLSQDDRANVDFWISCMGVSSAQTTLRYVLGGIDIISNYRLGIPNGVIGLLGHLIDMDSMAADVVEKKFAFLTDARLDMSRIAAPVLWICGLYDKWVDVDEVKDLMSVKAVGDRELLEIPTGHNLRTSDDAIHTFKLIASWIHEKLYGKKIAAWNPHKEELLRVLTEERERLENRAAPPLAEYWRGYLIGNERNKVGYDFYRNIPEFTDFLRAQAKALQLGHDEVIADLGCGTGIFLEQLLEFVAREEDDVSVKEITAVDLVQDALDKTRNKCEAVLAMNPRLAGIKFRYLQKDLQPSRLIPVLRFIEDGEMNLGALRNRIEGLSSKVLDGLVEKATPELLDAMRGSALDERLMSRLTSTLDAAEMQTVVEFNRAARFLLDRITSGDLRSKTSPLSLSSALLRCSNLVFERLCFGDSGNVLTFDFPKEHFSKIVASLFISYVLNPEYILTEFYQMLRPEGLILLSSMKPDSDISMMFTNYIRKTQVPDCSDGSTMAGESGVEGARAMLNEAASLFELEEDGFFRFYTPEELRNMLAVAGFVDISILPSMGSPPQAYIAVGRKRLTL